jgi:hypothetical protein
MTFPQFPCYSDLKNWVRNYLKTTSPYPSNSLGDFTAKLKTFVAEIFEALGTAIDWTAFKENLRSVFLSFNCRRNI